MRITRLVALVVAVAAFGALLAGVTGVWGPGPAKPPPLPEDAAKTPKDVIVIKPFPITQGGFKLNAPKAWMTLSGDTRLFDPRFELKLVEKPVGKPTAGPLVTLIQGRANEGSQSAGNKDVVNLRGDVVITATGARVGVVRVPEFALDTKTQKGYATGKVTFEFKALQGRQTGSCENAEWDVQAQRGALLSKCHFVLTGWRMMGPSAAGAVNAPNTPPLPVHVTCAGRADVDLLNGVTKLHRDAHVRQGKGEMISDLLTLRFDRTERQVRQVVAAGNVRFSDPSMDLKGRGDKLTVLPEDRSLEIVGKPSCRLDVTGATVTAPKVRLHGEQVECIGEGRMLTTAPGDGKARARALRVQWTKRMLYRRDRGEAEFWGRVTLVESGNRLACEHMSVAFSREDRSPRRVEADGGVDYRSGEAAGAPATRLTCERMALDMAPGAGQPSRLEAVGKVVFRTAAGKQAGASELKCDRMVVAFGKKAGHLANVVATGKVESRMAARPGEAPSRIACNRMTVAFAPDGRTATKVTADGAVDFKSPEGKGSASHLVMEPKSDRVTLVGKPARLTDRTGQSLSGEAIRIDRKQGIVESDKPGVFVARLPGGKAPGAAKPGATGQETVHAEWRKRMRYWIEPGRALLEGGVNIRIGPNTLTSEWVEIRRPEERLVSRGPGELTVTVPAEQKAQAAGAGGPLARATKGAAGAKPSDRLRISWRKGMTYEGRRREAVFTGGASLRHGPYALDADTLTAYLDEQRHLDRGVARGDVRCRDTARGYRGRGDRLDWSPRTGVATLRGAKGKPAELFQRGAEGVLAEEFVFSDDFRRIRVKGMRFRPGGRE